MPAATLLYLAGGFSMTKDEKKRMSAIVHATEYLFLENIALKLVLEHRAVPNWRRLLEKLLADEEILSGVRLEFRELYSALEKSADSPGALAALTAKLPRVGNPH
jgi:hypothetical protein